MLFPSELDALLNHPSQQEALDATLLEACRPHVAAESFADLIAAAAGVLAQRLAQKAGIADGRLPAGWPEQIDWEAANFTPGRAQALIGLCQATLACTLAFPATAKTDFTILLLVDMLLGELDHLLDASPPVVTFDGRSFFAELVKSLNALLPYEQRDFPAEMTPTRLRFALLGLPEGACYLVEIVPPRGDEPGRIEMSAVFESGDLDDLARHWKRKVPGLGQSMGGKEIVLIEGENRLAVVLGQPYKPTEKLSAFMLAATLVGLIGSVQERMPRQG